MPALDTAQPGSCSAPLEGSTSRSHPLARSPLAARANGWLERLWDAGICSRPSLDPEMLWEKASGLVSDGDEYAGRTERDVADFRFRLKALCASLSEEAALNPLGLTFAHGQLTRVIRQRLELGKLWRQKPEILTQPLVPPIIVVGHMRAGTTRIHRLLAVDPAHTGTRFCDSWHPCPPHTGIEPDMRPIWSTLMLFVARRLDPWLDSIHPFGVRRPDEELGWLAAALNHSAYESQWRIPSYSRMSEARDPAPIYAEFARILRTDIAFRENGDRPRILKVPQFTEDLPALLAQFPDARVVLAQRDPEDVAASASSVVANQMAMQSDEADLAWIETECRRKISLRQKRMDQTFAAFGGPLAKVRFEALNRDWETQIARIYDDLGLMLTPKALAAMRKEQGRARSSPHHEHRKIYESFDRNRPAYSDGA